MVSINTFLLVSTGLLAKPMRTQGYGLGADPVLLRNGQDGITISDENNMVYGAPIPPQTYTMTDAQGNTVVFNSTQDVQASTDNREDAPNQDGGDQLESAYSPQENSDLYYMERAFGTQFIKNADQINRYWKKSSPPKTAWPRSNWPIFQDGINVRCDDGAPSPAEKYARANGLNVAQFMNAVSARSGIDSQSRYQRCTTNNQCGEGDACGIRPGRSFGYCIATWTGICHAWAPAAILEEEPRCPVNVNGVTFKSMDIRALITQLYDGAGTQAVSAGIRFDGGDGDRQDQFGRFVNYAHRDIGPAVFHIALANIIGRLRKTFVIDAAADYTVWNQPVRSYEFSDPYVMTPSDAADYFFGTPSYAVFNPRAVRVHYVRNTFQYVGEGYDDGALSDPGRIEQYTTTLSYEYWLELDAYNSIIGGEWVGESRTKHPDFMWVPLNKPNPNMVSSVGISYGFVSYLIQQSARGRC